MPFMARTRSVAVFALAVLALSGAGGASAEEPIADAVLILDSSLAMAARLDGSRKSILTRTAVPNALATQTGPMNLGLLAYGHRKRKGCGDIESLWPLQAFDAKRLTQAIGAVRPRGQAPLAAALRAGALALAEAPGPRSLILVAGQADTCGQDPCVVARELAAGKPGVIVHVLGVALPQESLGTVQCIADATGGHFANVQTGAEIVASAAEMLALVTRSADKPEPSAVPMAPELVLSASLGPDAPAIAEAVTWRVTRGSETVFAGSAVQPRMPLAAGTYAVTASLGTVTVAQDVTVATEGPTEATIALNAAALTIRTLSGPDLAPVANASTTLYRVGADAGEPAVVAVSRDLSPSFVVPPGSYRIVVEDGLARVERSLSLEAGRSVTETIELLIGTLRLEARATPNGAPLEGVFFFVTEDDPESPGGQREVARSAASQPSFTLPAGAYHVLARQGRAEARTDVALRTGVETRQIVEMSTAVLAIESQVPANSEGFDAGWTIVVTGSDPLTGEEHEVLRTTRHNPRLVLPAGKYRVTGRFGAVNAAISQEVVVRAGVDQAVRFEPQAGFVELVLGDIESASVNRDIFWELKDSNGNRVLSTAASRPKVVLAPGDYRVTATHQKKQFVSAFTLAKGERKAVAVAPE